MADKAPAAKGGKAKKLLEEAKPVVAPLMTPVEVLYRNLFLLDKYVESRDGRFLGRIMRYTAYLRKALPSATLAKAVNTYITDPSRAAAVSALMASALEGRVEPILASPAASSAGAAAAGAAAAAPGDVEMAPAAAAGAGGGGAGVGSPKAGSAGAAGEGSSKAAGGKAAGGKEGKEVKEGPELGEAAAPVVVVRHVKPPKPSAAGQQETEAYFTILALGMLAGSSCWAQLGTAASAAATSFSAANRRTLDWFAARAWSYTALAAEKLQGPEEAAALREQLTAAHRTATLRHDEYGQAVLLNTLLRSLLRQRLYDAAGKLVAKAPFPESASTAQLVRYLYYKGRIAAVQLQYSDAFAALLQAARKAPPSAVSFRAMAMRLAVVVQLLMGELPERAVFREPGVGPRLSAYLELTQAVRLGDVSGFKAVVARHEGGAFARDGTLALVQRLEASVIRAGLRKIAASYSRITFVAIAERLGMGGPEDAQFLAAKAIKDGVIEAELDAAAGVMVSQEQRNVYSTKEPQEAFHRRITFCLDVHHEAVKSMWYPPSAGKPELESAEAKAAREAEEADIEEGLEDMGDDEEDDF